MVVVVVVVVLVGNRCTGVYHRAMVDLQLKLFRIVIHWAEMLV